MTDIATELTELAGDVRRLTEEKHHAAPLVQAFGTLLVGLRRWLVGHQEKTTRFSIDPLKFQEGISLIQQGQLLQPEDPWPEAGLAVIEAITEGFPLLAQDMRRLGASIGEGRCDCFSLCEPAHPDLPLGEKDRIENARRLGIDPVSLQFFQRGLARLLLMKKSRDLNTELTPLAWKKGYCPICGSFPHLAILRDQGRRWLQCSTCSHEWSFPRLTCPYCEHEEPEKTNYFFVDGEQNGTAFTCDHCLRYLLTSNQAGNLRRIHADLVALGLVHLDLILQDKGFQPMAECEWNTFRVSCAQPS